MTELSQAGLYAAHIILVTRYRFHRSENNGEGMQEIAIRTMIVQKKNPGNKWVERAGELRLEEQNVVVWWDKNVG